MKYPVKSLVLAFILFSAGFGCRQVKYEIMDAKESQSESAQSFVECKMLQEAAGGVDTVLYYRMSFDGRDWQFKQSPRLNIGLRLTTASQPNLLSYNYVYLATTAAERTDTLVVRKDFSYLALSNFQNENGNTRTEASFAPVVDAGHKNPLVSKQITDPKKMVNVIELFHEELRRSLQHGRQLQYTTIAHVGGYASTTEIVVEFK